MDNHKQKAKKDSLSKYLAQSGFTSRRKAVEFIRSGKVTVNGVVITEPGYKIDGNGRIAVEGMIIQSIDNDRIYILLNKPKNCVSTVSDELGRTTVLELLSHNIKQRVYPIGRLDRNTTGLLIVTNDGDLTVKLSHPRFEIEKIYHVHLDKPCNQNDMNKLVTGITLHDGLTHADHVFFIEGRTKKDVGVVLHSGKYRIVRRLFKALGYEVKKLDRVCYAGITKNGLKTGEWRYLTSQEVAYLRQLS